MPAKKKTPKKPAKAPPKKAAKPSRAAKKPAPSKAAAPKSRMARAIESREHAPEPARRPALQPRPEPAEQLGLPDIDQVRDAEMERHYLDLVDAKAARTAAQDRIHEVEAAIQVRFDRFAEQDPDDPRTLVYIASNGAPLRPKTVRKVSVGRPPAKPKKALEDAQRQAAEPDLPGGDE